jgi:threonine dehydrogenase-like Zn-dependent dehydrogenase
VKTINFKSINRLLRIYYKFSDFVFMIMFEEHIIPKEPSTVHYDQNKKMQATKFHGKFSVKLEESPMPIVTDQTDAIIKITATTVCGSDLHFYHNEVPGMEKGDILGHECVGIVDDIGSEVSNIKRGDRVVVSAVIACGRCSYCKRGEWSCCDTTNHSKAMQEMYGHSIAGVFGYSHLTGGYDGCQAEYVRVPYADINLFKIPDDIPDSQAILISDIACTGYHGTELCDLQEGDNVVVFGCGPVGQMAIMWSKFKKAKTVIAIDLDAERLHFAATKFGAVPINSKEEDPVKAVRKFLPDGPDKVIDCVGFRFPESMAHKVEKVLHLETDSPNIVNAAIQMCRKNGRIALIGDYFGYANHFNIGAFMEKHLTMRGGQVWPHKYYSMIFQKIKAGLIDPSVVLTHVFPLSKISEVYAKFDKHEDGIMKPLVIPDAYFKGRMA